MMYVHMLFNMLFHMLVSCHDKHMRQSAGQGGISCGDQPKCNLVSYCRSDKKQTSCVVDITNILLIEPTIKAQLQRNMKLIVMAMFKRRNHLPHRMRFPLAPEKWIVNEPFLVLIAGH